MNALERERQRKNAAKKRANEAEQVIRWLQFKLLQLAPRTNVCPRCANGRPTCTNRKPSGRRYTHEEACATYEWSDDTCAECDRQMAREFAEDESA